MNEIDISIIIPVFNEEKGLDELYARLKPVLDKISPKHEMIFVNDGSKDQSLGVLKRLASTDSKVRFIGFSRNFGHQIAVTAGLDAALGKAVGIIDADLQDPPEVLEEMYAKYQEGYKVVYGKRLSRKGETLFKKWTAKMFYRMLSSITSFDIPVDTGDFRIIDRKVVDTLKKMPENNRYLRGQIAWTGFSQTFVYFHRDERKHGQTGYTFGKMLRFALDGITSFSGLPLKIASFAGFFVSFFALLVILYALYSKFIKHEVVTGWTSLIISTMFIGGIQLLTIGIIGEYIGRISTDVKNRPLYIVDETNIDSPTEERES